MHVCTAADLGPSFVAWSGTVHGTATALISERAQHDDTVALQAIELLQRFGIDCSTCTACPLGLNRRVN